MDIDKELELLLDHYLIYDAATDRLLISGPAYYKTFLPELKKLFEKANRS